MKRKAIILYLCTSIILTGCGATGNVDQGTSQGTENEQNTEVVAEETEEIEKPDPIDSCKTAFQSLNAAAEVAIEYQDCIGNAWYYSIYADDIRKKLGYRELNADTDQYMSFAEYTGLSSSEVDKAMLSIMSQAGMNWYAQGLFLKANYCVQCVQTVYEENGTISATTELLDSTKELIKSTSEIDPECKYLEELKLYYSDIVACIEHSQSISGNYKEYTAENATYQEKLNTHKNTLSFDLD